MSEPMTHRTELERDLAALATAIDWPATPDVAASVRVRLAAGSPRPRRRWWLAPPRLGRPLLIALLLLAVLAAVAAAVAFGLPGLRITFTSDPLPTPTASAAPSIASAASATPGRAPGADLGLGTPMTLEAVRARVDFDVPVAAVAGRTEPDAVYLEAVRGAELVNLVWRHGAGLPPLRAGSDVGLLVTVFRAALDERLLEKVLQRGTTIEALTVAGHRGYWISGAEHLLWFRRPDGDVVETQIRLVGDVLALEVDGRILRFEVAGGRAAAIALAEQFVAP